MKSLKEMKFKSFKSLVTLSAGLSVFLMGTLATVGIAGCTSKPRSNDSHECKKYPAWHINPSKPVPKPKPKPKPEPKHDLTQLKKFFDYVGKLPISVELKTLKTKPNWLKGIKAKQNQQFLTEVIQFCLPDYKLYTKYLSFTFTNPKQDLGFTTGLNYLTIHYFKYVHPFVVDIY